jgi:hypothetical protein
MPQVVSHVIMTPPEPGPQGRDFVAQWTSQNQKPKKVQDSAHGAIAHDATSGKRKNAEFILIHLKCVFKMN